MPCSRLNTNTSWLPLAGAWLNTGPRLRTVIGSDPEKAGKRFGTMRICHSPPSP